MEKKVKIERSDSLLSSIARRDDGFYNPSTPTLMKALSQDGAFFVLGHEACFKVLWRKK